MPRPTVISICLTRRHRHHLAHVNTEKDVPTDHRPWSVDRGPLPIPPPSRCDLLARRARPSLEYANPLDRPSVEYPRMGRVDGRPIHLSRRFVCLTQRWGNGWGGGSSDLVRGFMRKFHEFDHFGGSVLDIWHFGFPLTDVQSQPMAKGKRKTENSKLKTPEVSAHT